MSQVCTTTLSTVKCVFIDLCIVNLHWFKKGKSLVFYPLVVRFLTVRITEAFGLPKQSLFSNVQRDAASLPSYSKLNSNSYSYEVV